MNLKKNYDLCHLCDHKIHKINESMTDKEKEKVIMEAFYDYTDFGMCIILTDKINGL